mmetsp:Transcript_41644/g.126052  ORF Transcript_41644/g.126052 Transcript_41644/m.126052 type:complete len:230 (-) Transcript_41644:863-1552(-)
MPKLSSCHIRWGEHIPPRDQIRDGLPPRRIETRCWREHVRPAGLVAANVSTEARSVDVHSALACDKVLCNEADEGHHRQTAIVNLLEFEILPAWKLLVIGNKDCAPTEDVPRLVGRRLAHVRREPLQNHDGEHDLEGSAYRQLGAVDQRIVRDGGACSRITERVPACCHVEPTQDSQHANSAVFQLHCAPTQQLLIRLPLGQARRIPAVLRERATCAFQDFGPGPQCHW